MAASGTISGNTGGIKQIAGTIREDANGYGTAMQLLFQTVDALKATWTSEDGNAFIAKINSHKEAFTTLQTNLESSAGTFEEIAINYEKTIVNNTI